jgi:hypothetical protein
MNMNLYRTLLRELERSKARQREERRRRFAIVNSAAKNRASHSGIELFRK